MKIAGNNAPHKTEFKNIKLGEVFFDFDTYYMKVPKVVESLGDERYIDRNAIILEEGGVEYALYDEDDEVIPIEAELVIKRRGLNNENCKE